MNFDAKHNRLAELSDSMEAADAAADVTGHIAEPWDNGLIVKELCNKDGWVACSTAVEIRR